MAKSEGSFTRSLFPYSYRAHYTFSLSLAPGFISRAYDALCRFLAEDLFANELLVNLKGRDPSQLLLEEGAPPKPHEILYARGILYDIADPDHPKEKEHFHCSLLSPYEKSTGGSIHHRSVTHSDPSLPDYIKVQELGRIFPAELTLFRFGVQKFSSRRFSSFIGLAPIITGSILIDCSKDTLHLAIVDEALMRKSAPWNDNYSILSSVNQALQWICDFDLKNDIEEKLDVSYN